MGRRVMYVLALLFVVAGAAWLTATPTLAQSKTVYVIEVRPTYPPDGHALFDANCAACHGDSGQGIDAKVRPIGGQVPDLTRIAARDGRFDVTHVMVHVENGPGKTMPDWHRVLHDSYQLPVLEQLAIRNLALYVKGLQMEP